MKRALYPVEPNRSGHKYLILGTGQLACAFEDLLGEQCMLVGHGHGRPLPGTLDANPYRLRIEDRQDVERVLSCAAPFVHTVVNCMGLLRRETCEEEFDHAYQVNAFGPGHVARWCGKNGKKFVQVSDAEVFPGKIPFGARYQEGDPVGALSLYATSKRLGEQMAYRFNKRSLIVRTSSLFSGVGSHGYLHVSPDQGTGWNNLLDIIYKGEQGLEQGWPDDCYSVPTDARAVAWAIHRLVSKGRHGLRHVVSGGVPATPYEFARAVESFALTDHGRTYGKVFRTLNRDRLVPGNTSLGSKFPRDLLGLPTWSEALREVVATFYG